MDGTATEAPPPSRSVIDLLRPHVAGFLIVLALAAALAAPRWWLLATDPAEGARVQVDPGGAYGIGWDEALYVPVIREAYDGSLPPGDPYLYEHQDDPPLSFAWWPALIGQLGRALGDMFVAFALVHTAAVIAGLILLYALAYRISGSRLAAAAAAPLAMLVAQVLYQSHGFWALRHRNILEELITIDPPGEFHTWFRFLAPSMALAVTFGVMLCLKEAVETRRRSWQIATALVIALAVYTNPFLWTAFILAIALWSASVVVEHDLTALREVALMACGGLLLAAPEFVIVALNVLDTPRDAAERAGLRSLGLEKEFLGIITQRFLAVGALAAFAWPPGRVTRLWIAFAISPLLLACTSGLIPQVDHFLYQVWVPFTIPLSLEAASRTWRRFSVRFDLSAAIAIAAVALAAAVYVGAFQVRAIGELDQDYAVRNDEVAAISWIDEHLEKDDVVVTPSRSTNYLLAALTPVYVYVAGGAGSVGARASDDEIIDRYLRASAAFGYSVDDTLFRLDPDNGIPRPEREDIPQDEIERYVERSMVDFLLNELVDRPNDVRRRLPEWRDDYLALLAQPNVLGSYRATYLYCGPRERLWGAASAGTRDVLVVPVFTSETVAVYRLVADDEPAGVPLHGCNATSSVKIGEP